MQPCRRRSDDLTNRVAVAVGYLQHDSVALDLCEPVAQVVSENGAEGRVLGGKVAVGPIDFRISMRLMGNITNRGILNPGDSVVLWAGTNTILSFAVAVSSDSGGTMNPIDSKISMRYVIP